MWLRERKENNLLVTCFIFSSRFWRRSSTPESTNAAEQADARFSEVSDRLGWVSVFSTVFGLLAIWSEPFKDCLGSLTSCAVLATTWNWETLEVKKIICFLHYHAVYSAFKDASKSTAQSCTEQEMKCSPGSHSTLSTLPTASVLLMSMHWNTLVLHSLWRSSHPSWVLPQFLMNKSRQH